jgi:hypothetical protein
MVKFHQQLAHKHVTSQQIGKDIIFSSLDIHLQDVDLLVT